LGCSGGTTVKVWKAIGLEVGIDKVPVGDGCWVRDTTPCVDIALKVWAADVYSASSVAAGCGVAPIKVLHAKITTKANARNTGFLKIEILTSASIK
jgi:hypothetical protein